MSNRLDQDRETELQPKRIKSCKSKLEELGFKILQEDNTKISFMFKNKIVMFWPYSGWFTGSTVQSGRGFNNLLKKLNYGNN